MLSLSAFSDSSVGAMSEVLALWTTSDEPASTSIKRRPPITDVASHEAYQVAREWIEDCENSHVSCEKIEDMHFPTRLLDVGDSTETRQPRVIEQPKGTKGRYVALSYCWGVTGQRQVLTLERLKSGSVQFPLESLPRTFREAITVTKHLGYRFLWIDALCIIQEGDNGEDFQREGALMGDVYANASITIAASGAESVHEGMFRHSIPFSESCPIPYDLADGSLSMAQVCRESIYHFLSASSDSYEIEPLNRRGWCLQERVLSRRVLVYNKDQLSWACRTTALMSGGPLNPPRMYHEISDEIYSFDGVECIDFSVPSEPDEDASSRYMKFWSQAISFYSRRQLTRPADKLKALSSLAKAVQVVAGDTYVAGMWSSCLLQQLTWSTTMPKDQSRFESEHRSNSYIAPSWSWACLDYPISPLPIRDHFEHCALAEIIDVHVEPVTEVDCFGEIRSGFMTVRGRIFNRLYVNEWISNFGGTPIVGTDVYAAEEEYATASLTKTHGSNLESSIVYLPVLEQQLTGLGADKYITALMLIESERDESEHFRAAAAALGGAFVRIGHAQFQPGFRKYLESVEERTIRIV